MIWDGFMMAARRDAGISFLDDAGTRTISYEMLKERVEHVSVSSVCKASRPIRAS